MRIAFLMLLAFNSLLAQIEPGDVQEQVLSGDIKNYSRILLYEVSVINGQKTLQISVEDCNEADFEVGRGECTTVSQDQAFQYSAVGAVMEAFYNQYPDGDVDYGGLASPSDFRLRLATNTRRNVTSALTTVQPVAPQDPRMIFLDGLGNSLIALDMNTLTVAASVVVPSTVGPFGIRPNQTGPANEVWVANYGLQVSVADLNSQTIVATIPTPGLPSSAPPSAIVFTPDGKTAFEGITFYSPDASGNHGALLVFDAVNRKLTSTTLMASAPGAMFMAPDGLTLYMIESTSDGASLVYYDVLSGTADLVAPTATPGVSSGYSGGGFIHPDGTRLFWNSNYLFYVFDLTTRKVIHQFNSGLSSSSGPAMTVSKDGSQAYFSDRAGDVVIMNTSNGNIITQYNTGVPTSILGGPPVSK